MRIEAIPPSVWLAPSAWRGPQAPGDPSQSLVASPAIPQDVAEFTIPAKPEAAATQTSSHMDSSSAASAVVDDTAMGDNGASDLLTMVARILRVTGAGQDVPENGSTDTAAPAAMSPQAAAAYQECQESEPQLDLAA